eukprot:248709_1
MVFERMMVKGWNRACRMLPLGTPIYNYPIKTNFLGLSPKSASFINNFYQNKLPMNIFKGTNIEVDVLNNRRHQIIGVFMPMLLILTCGVQFTMYQFTKAPTIKRQSAAPGWEVPKDYSFTSLPPTPANVALWRKKQELGHKEWDYKMGDVIDVAAGTHPWNLHKHDHSGHGDDDDDDGSGGHH